jgi:hypothetical protein
VLAVDPAEPFGIQPPFELAERDIQQVTPSCRVRRDVAPTGFEAYHRGHCDRHDGVPESREQSLDGTLPQCFSSAGQHGGPTFRIVQPAPDPLEGPVKTPSTERLDQVVDGLQLERRHGVMVVRGREDHRWLMVGVLEHLESRELGHRAPRVP